MKRPIIGLLLIFLGGQCSFAQNSSTELEIRNISAAKWQWMADKNVDKLNTLFHDSSKFVHMSGTWKKNEELDIIKTGGSGIRKLMCTMLMWKFLTMSPSFGTVLHWQL